MIMSIKCYCCVNYVPIQDIDVPKMRLFFSVLKLTGKGEHKEEMHLILLWGWLVYLGLIDKMTNQAIFQTYNRHV